MLMVLYFLDHATVFSLDNSFNHLSVDGADPGNIQEGGLVTEGLRVVEDPPPPNNPGVFLQNILW